MSEPDQMRIRPVTVLNPGGGALDIADIDATIRQHREQGTEPYVDLGGGMQVPLAELADIEQESGRCGSRNG